MTTNNECPACGKPTDSPDFCARPECMTYGSGACAPGPSIVNHTCVCDHCRDAGTCFGCDSGVCPWRNPTVPRLLFGGVGAFLRFRTTRVSRSPHSGPLRRKATGLKGDRTMRDGTYTDRNGESVSVRRTASGGYRLTRADGTVTMIGGAR